jgi:hypothetical protein
VNYVIALMAFFFLIKWENVTKARGVFSVLDLNGKVNERSIENAIKE